MVRTLVGLDVERICAWLHVSPGDNENVIRLQQRSLKHVRLICFTGKQLASVLGRDEALLVLARGLNQSVTCVFGWWWDSFSACQRRCAITDDYRQVSGSVRQTAEQEDSGNILIMAIVALMNTFSQYVHISWSPSLPMVVEVMVVHAYMIWTYDQTAPSKNDI